MNRIEFLKLLIGAGAAAVAGDFSGITEFPKESVTSSKLPDWIRNIPVNYYETTGETTGESYKPGHINVILNTRGSLKTDGIVTYHPEINDGSWLMRPWSVDSSMSPELIESAIDITIQKVRFDIADAHGAWIRVS